MEKDVFNNVLQTDEQIVWSNGVNLGAYTKQKWFSSLGILAFMAAVVAQFVTIISGAILSDYLKDGIGPLLIIWATVWVCVFVLESFVSRILAGIESKKAFFAITNKRIIIRSGVFNVDYVHYSLKNIGTINVDGGIFDSKGDDPSATLNIDVKDFQGDHHTSVSVISLKSAYKAYNLLSEMVEGNNENIRVSINS